MKLYKAHDPSRAVEYIRYRYGTDKSTPFFALCYGSDEPEYAKTNDELVELVEHFVDMIQQEQQWNERRRDGICF